MATFDDVLRRADRRRRARLSVTGAAQASWAGLATGIALAAAWRLTGAPACGALSVAAVLLAAAAGAWWRYRSEDLFAAAAELDRRAGSEAALATGLEVARGGLAGPLAPLALAEAGRAARGLAAQGGEVPVAPPTSSRYLAIPAAVLAGLALLPASVTDSARVALAPAHAGAAGGARAVEIAPPGTRPDGRLRELTRAERLALLEAYRERRAGADAPSEAAALPPAPPMKRIGDGGAGGSREGAGSEGGGGAGAPGRSQDDDGVLGGALGGPLDDREAAAIRERFPEYEDLVRRYFEGPTRENDPGSP